MINLNALIQNSLNNDLFDFENLENTKSYNNFERIKLCYIEFYYQK